MVALKAVNEWRAPRPRVEILGLFGAGKTTLATTLANGFCTHLAEDHAANPFWGREDVVEVTGQLPYDLMFLLQHCRVAAEPPIDDRNPLGICDWSFTSDRLWASMRSEDGMEIYDAVLRHCRERLGDPVGYLYLRQPVEVVASRLLKRGRRVETPLLKSLAMALDALEDLVARLPPSRVVVCGDTFLQYDLQRVLPGWLAEAKA